MAEQVDRKMQELQVLEQAMQGILMQKQAFQMELNEATNAFEEVRASKDAVFKIVGHTMIKADKQSVEKELLSKKNILDIRIKAIEKQEQELSKRLDNLRQEVMGKL